MCPVCTTATVLLPVQGTTAATAAAAAAAVLASVPSWIHPASLARRGHLNNLLPPGVVLLNHPQGKARSGCHRQHLLRAMLLRDRTSRCDRRRGRGCLGIISGVTILAIRTNAMPFVAHDKHRFCGVLVRSSSPQLPLTKKQCTDILFIPDSPESCVYPRVSRGGVVRCALQSTSSVQYSTSVPGARYQV